MNESDLRKFVKAKWNLWADWLEPRGNAGLGRPDVDLLIDGVIAPVELKTGKHVVDCTFRPSKIRPQQVGWHTRFHGHGGVSFFIIGDNYDNLWIASEIIGHEEGYTVWHFGMAARLRMSHLQDDIVDFVRGARKVAFQFDDRGA